MSFFHVVTFVYVSFLARTFAWHDEGRFSDGTEMKSAAKGIQMIAMLVTEQAECQD